MCAKTLRFDAVIKVVNDIVKFNPAKALNHRQFQNFLTAEWKAGHGDIRWLSGAKVLKRIAELKDVIQEFMTIKNKLIFEFDDPQFKADFAFLADTPSHQATVNFKLQQRGQLIYVFFSYVNALQAKLKLWNSSFVTKISVIFH